jgi:hypothetical protein
MSMPILWRAPRIAPSVSKSAWRRFVNLLHQDSSINCSQCHYRLQTLGFYYPKKLTSTGNMFLALYRYIFWPHAYGFMSVLCYQLVVGFRGFHTPLPFSAAAISTYDDRSWSLYQGYHSTKLVCIGTMDKR